MTPSLLQPLLNAIIGAHLSDDPALWSEASRRFLALDDQMDTLPLLEREVLEHRLYRMLPSDWPLWMESSRYA